MLEGEFTFSNIEDVFKSEVRLSEAGVISFAKNNGVSTVRLHLNKDSFKQISSFLPGKENALIDVFGPAENEDTSESDYLEMLEFMLGDKGPAGVKASFIELRVKVKGKILSQSGGKIEGNSVLFRIPLLQVLLLDRPLDYSIAFE